MKRWSKILMFTLVAWCGLGGCVKEVMDDCPLCSFALYGITDSAADDLAFNQGELFLFDSNGTYITTMQIKNDLYETLGQGAAVDLETEIANGEYKVVFWGYNSSSSLEESSYVTVPATLVAGVTNIDDITINGVELDELATRSSSTLGPERDIWTGELTFTHANGDRSERVTHDVTVRQQTKTIDVTASYILSSGSATTRTEGLTVGNTVEITCYDADLDMSGASRSMPTYYPYKPFAEQQLDSASKISQYRKMSLHKASTQPILTVWNDGEVLYEEYLFTILEATGYTSQYYLDVQNHYEIDVEVVVGEAAINIWVNGWRYVAVDGDVKYYK